MIFGMTVFGEENMWEKFFVFFDSVDMLEYLSALRDPEAPSFTEIVLNIDYYECSWHIQKNILKTLSEEHKKDKLTYSGEYLQKSKNESKISDKKYFNQALLPKIKIK